jgi:CRP-like cAMP-binding protein
MEYVFFLRRHIEEIVTLSPEAFEQVAAFFTGRHIQRKEFLLKAGQRVISEFLVVEGCLKVMAYDDAGKEFILQFAQENWWVSDYPAYTRQSSAETDVQAVENSFVLELSAENRTIMCERVPEMHVFFERKAFKGYIASQKRVLSLLRNSAKEKYDLLLDQYPELFQRLPQKVIAQYLGISRETLSRLGKRQ